jgi:TfoX/Sxy family transcriptional regulator of competence genes
VATSKETIEFILDQLAPLPVRVRAMFGGHALYCDEKVVALIGDDTLFVKPTAATRELFGDAEMAPPYPGAKDYHVVTDDRLHDVAWLQDIITRTAEQLPVPKKKALT